MDCLPFPLALQLSYHCSLSPACKGRFGPSHRCIMKLETQMDVRYIHVVVRFTFCPCKSEKKHLMKDDFNFNNKHLDVSKRNTLIHKHFTLILKSMNQSRLLSALFVQGRTFRRLFVKWWLLVGVRLVSSNYTCWSPLSTGVQTSFGIPLTVEGFIQFEYDLCQTAFYYLSVSLFIERSDTANGHS